jgi:hypothetical protein
LVLDHDLIVVEALRVPQMSRRPKPRRNAKGGFDPNGARAKAGLNRSIADAGWGMLRSMLVYKAEDAGRELIAVDPRHTSICCASCGHTGSENRVSQAVFDVGVVVTGTTPMSTRPGTSFGPVGPNGLRPVQAWELSHYPTPNPTHG